MTGDVLSQDAADLADDARRLLLELDRDVPGAAALTADAGRLWTWSKPRPRSKSSSMCRACRPSRSASRSAATRCSSSARSSRRLAGIARFHLAERSYGRFARAMRLTGAFDASRARACLDGGELARHPAALDDRRGRVLHVPVERR